MTRATVSADGETITVRIPITFRKRGGRKLVVTPDGAEWAPRPRVDNAMVKALARFLRRVLTPVTDAGRPGLERKASRRHTESGLRDVARPEIWRQSWTRPSRDACTDDLPRGFVGAGGSLS